MMRALMCSAAIACSLPAYAESISISGTIVTLEPSQEPGVVAVVTFQNENVNGEKDNGAYLLSMPGLTVEAQFQWEVGIFGEDSITITPPDGMVCVPASCTATAMEGFTATVRLPEWQGA